MNNLAKLSDNPKSSDMYSDAKDALAFFSRIRLLIPSVIIVIVAFIFIIYGFKLIGTDDSYMVPTKVSITKILNSNNLTNMCQDKVLLTTKNDKYSSYSSQKTVYNCIIYVNLFNKERAIQVNDYPTNFVVGNEINIWYDKRYIDNELLLYYNSLRQYRYYFIGGGLLVIPLVIYVNYIVFNNDRLAMGLGVFDIANSLLRRS
jgi:hypothetical protein